MVEFPKAPFFYSNLTKIHEKFNFAIEFFPIIFKFFSKFPKLRFLSKCGKNLRMIC